MSSFPEVPSHYTAGLKIRKREELPLENGEVTLGNCSPPGEHTGVKGWTSVRACVVLKPGAWNEFGYGERD